MKVFQYLQNLHSILVYVVLMLISEPWFTWYVGKPHIKSITEHAFLWYNMYVFMS